METPLWKQLVDSEKHSIIYGKAGSGKSTLLRQIRSGLLANAATLAPTGIAALHINGETIHSFFGFKPHITPEVAKRIAQKTPKDKRSLYQKLTHILIDEVSMVRADLCDSIDVFLRTIRENDIPFGGVQVLLFGDLLQLPPILSREERETYQEQYTSPYFFAAKVWEQVPFHTAHWNIIHLTENYRQEEESLRQFLDNIREGTLSHGVIQPINSLLHGKEPQPESIILTTTNRRAAEINDRELEKLPGSPLTIEAQIQGNVGKDQYPCATEVTLNIGARVMLLNNDYAKRWQNGSLGTVIHIDIEHIEVCLDSGKTVRIKEHPWEIQKLTFNVETREVEPEVVGKFTQYPLQLAWAITIHKAQGKSFSHVHVDLTGGTFTKGQAYVALSRAETIEGLSIELPLLLKDLAVPSEPITFLSALEQQLHISSEETTECKGPMLIEFHEHSTNYPSRKIIAIKKTTTHLHGICPISKQQKRYLLSEIAHMEFV